MTDADDPIPTRNGEKQSAAPSLEDVFRKHLHISQSEADLAADWFASSAWGNPTGFYHRSADMKDLIDLRNAVSAMLRFDVHGSEEVQELLRLNMIQLDIETDTENATGAAEKWRPKSHDSFVSSKQFTTRWQKAIDTTIRTVEQSSLTVRSRRRVNVEGVNIVDRARLLWERKLGSPAPARGLNVATAFGKYLFDLFEACECEGDPRSAFHAWSRHIGARVHSDGETG